jgi:ribosomal protein S18 acetylase RimI-like enzyme
MMMGAITHPQVFFNFRTFKAGLNIFKAFLSGKTAHTSKPLELAPSHVAGGTATLASIAVDPAFTKNKVSDKLIDAAIVYVIQNNKKILRCGISRSNISSRFIFSKKGFLEDKVLSSNNDMYYYKKIQ